MQVQFGQQPSLSTLMNTANQQVQGVNSYVGRNLSTGGINVARASDVSDRLDEVKGALNAQNALLQAVVKRLNTQA